VISYTSDSYLRIPSAYGQALGGPRWSVGGDAVEFADGRTLAFSRELALFLDGFAAEREPIAFAHILHLVLLFVRGPVFAPSPRLDLAALFRGAQGPRPHRTAGAFCAWLCEDLPADPLRPDPEELQSILNSGAVAAPVGFLALPGDTVTLPAAGESTNAPEPPLTAEEFERLVVERLDRCSISTILSWLRNGQAPEEVPEAMIEAILDHRPRGYRATLETELDRPRLRGALEFVERLEGALVLPPRRRSRERLPFGGYADVSNKGRPERLLPSQFALETDELLRRFAENELLYFHREEPHETEAEGLVVVIDQGVRTWGEVRPILVAGALALAARADRTSVALRLGATSNDGELVDPLESDAQALGALLESADLSIEPSRALAFAIEQIRSAGWEADRADLVLLTHPRALREPEVERVAKSLPEGDRLFALTIDEHRDAQLAELRDGRPLTLSRFRIEPAKAEKPRQAARRRLHARRRAGTWDGDVEPIGFPFATPTGAIRSPKPGLFTFDASGDWFLAIGRLGVPQLWNSEEGGFEVLPRAMANGAVLRFVERVVGVRHGFLILGRTDQPNRRVAAHYDLHERTVTVRSRFAPAHSVWQTYYLESAHAIVETGRVSWFLDLKSGFQHRRERWRSAARIPEAIRQAEAEVARIGPPPPWITALNEDDTRPGAGVSVRLRNSSGTVSLSGPGLDSWRPFRPFQNGVPLLAERTLTAAMFQGRTLALLVDAEENGRWYLFRGPDPVLLPDPDAIGLRNLTLSPDGRRIAIRRENERFELHDVDHVLLPSRVTPPFQKAKPLEILLGRGWMRLTRPRALTIQIDWSNGRLKERRVRSSDEDNPRDPPIASSRDASGTHLPELVAYDPIRFRTSAAGAGLVATADIFGPVVLSDAEGRLRCMIHMGRDRCAYWTPEGVRWGDRELLGAEPTPDGDVKIAERLQRLSH